MTQRIVGYLIAMGVVCPILLAQEPQQRLADWLAVLSSSDSSSESVQTAMEEVRGLPSDVVLLALLSQLEQPAGAIYNCYGPEHDRQAPLPWARYCAVVWACGEHARTLPAEQRPALLVRLLRHASTPTSQAFVLSWFGRVWEPDAEPIVAGWFRAMETNPGVRVASARYLLFHRSEAYYEEALQATHHATGRLKDDLFRELGNAPHTTVDPRLATMGFDLIEEEMRKPDPYMYRAYFLAAGLGGYLDQRFEPDQTLPEYRDKGNLNERFFHDTVSNALSWWQANRERFATGRP